MTLHIVSEVVKATDDVQFVVNNANTRSNSTTSTQDQPL